MVEGGEREALERELEASRELVRELEAEVAALRPVAAELREELRELRALRAGLGSTGLGSTARFELDEEDWPAENGTEPARSAFAVAGPPPLPRPVVVPRLVLEAAFLVLTAAVAALAELEPVWIVIVMAGAWLLVALAEWAAWARQRRWRLDEVAPLIEERGSPEWYVPPVERTVLEPPDRAESHTMVSELPAAETGVQPAVELGDETDEEPPRKRRFWRRRKDDTLDGLPGDPWES